LHEHACIRFLQNRSAQQTGWLIQLRKWEK
jgi:hypothetical protein